MSRSGLARLQAIQPAIERRDRFLGRIKQASTRDAVAALMAEAIDMHIEANGHEPVGRDGRATVCMEDICASHCLRAAREAYAAFDNGGPSPIEGIPT